MRNRFSFYNALAAWLGYVAFLIAHDTARAQPHPGFALGCTTTTNYVAVPHRATLNAFPLTVTAWVNTRQNTGQQGLLNKYVANSLNGWNVFLRDGGVHAWYFVNNTRFVWDGTNGLNGGFVDDGAWHHVAFTVGASGGRLYVDGVLKASRAWTGAAGSPSTTQEMRFGNYPNDIQAVNGPFLLDEITVWNAALTQSQIQLLMANGLTGAEANLLAHYRCDEGSGSAVADSAPLDGNNNGLWIGPPFFFMNSPLVEARPAVAVSATDVRLNAVAEPNRHDTSAWFEWGVTTNYGNVTPIQALSRSIFPRTNLSEVLSGLTAGPTYHFRAVVSNNFGVAFGADEHFAILFTDIGVGVRGIWESAGAWGDYDNDGRLDFAVAGATNSGLSQFSMLEIWRNTGSGFTNIGAFPSDHSSGLWQSSLAWGDYDNDGRLDMAVIGLSSCCNSPEGAILRNTGSDFIPTFGPPRLGDGSLAWGDYDNDGRLDLLATGATNLSSRGLSQVRRNTGSNFMDINAGLPGVSASFAAWEDFDNDGRLDILLTGSSDNFIPISQVWLNTGNGFTNINAGLPGVAESSVACADYDNDGRADILLAGRSTNEAIAQVWRNTGNGFTNINAGLPGVNRSSVAWGDFDNDGRRDILLTGLITNSVPISQIWRNTGNGFTKVNPGLPGVYSGSVACGDYDNDGRLDILLTGNTDSSRTRPITQLWRNLTPLTNTPPLAPTGLTATLAGDIVMLSWHAGSDAETPATGLTYNVRIGTVPGASDVIVPMSSATGVRRLPQTGNAQSGLTTTFRYTLGTAYYCSVQAIDGAFAGSPFAADGSFKILQAEPAFVPITATHVVPGDLDGDGVLNEGELNAVLANYFANSPFLHMTNVAGLGGTNVTFALTNSLAGAFGVEFSTNLLDWLFLGPANPRYKFTDANAPAEPQRYYRLRWP